jgi:cytochrome-b5 reductase
VFRWSVLSSVFLSPQVFFFCSVLLTQTKRFIFELPSSDHVLGLHIASAVLTKFTRENGKNVLRPYTPVSDPDVQGKFELVIKRYEKGLMSQHIHSLKPNDTLAFKGPLPKYRWSPNLHKEIALIGGGTGITPLYQLMRAIYNNPDDNTKVNLIYGNISEDDILLRQEIDSLVKAKPDQFNVTYFLDKPSKGWTGQSGYINKEFLQKEMFPPTAENVKVFVCGPPPFYKALSGEKVSPQDQGELTGILKELGFTKDQVYKF